MTKLRKYQAEAVEGVRNLFRQKNKRCLLVLPTGAGKTIVFNHVAGIAKGNVLILVHRIELLQQTVDKYGGEIGVIVSGKPTPNNRVIVGMVSTVVNRLAEMPPPSLIIIDEAHHANATTYTRITSHFNCHVLGVTATPCRADGSGLRKSFDAMFVGPSINQLVELGHLSPPRVFAPSEIDTRAIKITVGDFDKKQSVELMEKPQIVGDIISNYKTIGKEQTAVVFCISVAHAKNMAEKFREAGYTAESIDGNTPKDERKKILAELGKSLNVLCSCDIISEGFDVPDIAVAILLRPTQSRSLYIQQVGRALRKAEGKNEAIIIDHVGNTKRHGHILSEQNWNLDAEKVKGRIKTEDEEDVNIRQCLQCYSIFLAPSVECPNCGAEVETKQRKIEAKAGELVEIQAEQKRKKDEQRFARSLEDLIEIGKKRGYKPGWARHIWKVRQQRKK